MPGPHTAFKKKKLSHEVALRQKERFVTAKIYGAETLVLFTGAQGDLVGVDQCNVRLPGSLAGRGEINVALMVDGKAYNAVKVGVE
jgi:uncharacterized protein (TIGR03437 family)